MEFLTIFLSGLLGLITPAGLVVDKTAENAVRSLFAKTGQLQVRIDNVPTHQLLQGRINRVRIAGRSLQLKHQDIRIAALELETDALQLDIHSPGKRPKLKQPIQAALRLVITETDVNKILQSPEFLARFRKLNIISRSSTNTDSNPGYYFANAKVKFLPKNRVSLQVEIREEGNAQPLLAKLETGVNIVKGRQLQLINPVAKVNEEQVPPQFIDVIVNNFNQRLDLRSLEANGLLMRILQLNMKPGELEIAAFVRVEPSSKFLNVKL